MWITHEVIYDFLDGISGSAGRSLVPGDYDLIHLLGVAARHLNVHILVVCTQLLYHGSLSTNYLRVILRVNLHLQRETPELLEERVDCAVIVTREERQREEIQAVI